MPSSPACAQGHEQVRIMYGDHHRWLVTWLHRKLGCGFDAADIAHDTFHRLLAAPGGVGEVREPRAYLTTLAHGLAIDRLRRRKMERAYLEQLAQSPEPVAPSPESQALLIEALCRVDRMLDGLNPKAKSAFLMSRLDGVTYPDIARRLRVSLSSVEKYMATAIRHCYEVRYG
ncbi:sigma-70 region 2 [Bordetella bronchiseptica GA96-01]|uniref:sigma-70 family RNA polymerase sigma factor n=1 Tax=Bordetella bronchiseptica TaxID=518 RepID=UPI00045B5D5E|nr:sigma-70 family RNA polymerase sigma factor [Bordetella bronchiseptica]KCV31882.1 sigma-70 region 2 [Bordetella bronchiseptica 00-P-2730]AZW30964.1 RNA polymerase subunit sigma [Bordetella bronchiseptica]KCV43327.1 sigma-70 region 2 [Bordetella bronchiseptica 345]KCV50779.1 sigma-70 region 2 [Bordetella bronchiseptica 7E71]KDC40449.1 sigma-70 region 2 [Bordetella bronchiseptica GA96-01]